ncbi:MAG: RNA polymerase subunit sigma-70 [Alphaproteobacteria bacterium]|nr:RNA polymerase subunit sigma-70 [Alphaproteobacteria bacterium]
MEHRITPDPQRSRATAEVVARASYGRLVAWLAARGAGIAAAEDALADAFVKALERWPIDGPPDNPEAWLLTAARRKLIDANRHSQVRHGAMDDILRSIDERDSAPAAALPDERLRLMYICAHPAIDPSIRTPLMLQTVLGLDARTIAGAFLTSPSTMGQRLVRAKRKIAEARIVFADPDPEDLAERTEAVLDAIYAAFGAHFDDAQRQGAGLAEEALFLARLVARLTPKTAEAHGLVALIAFIHARDAARSPSAAYIPFDSQDTTLWRVDLISEAELSLATAAQLATHGRYQLEAAIQSAHVARRLYGADTRRHVVMLYDRLLTIAPSVAAIIARAAAINAAGEPEQALISLDAIDPQRVDRHQPYWATRAAIAARLNLPCAVDCYQRAIGLSDDASVRSFLAERQNDVTA